MALPFHDFVKRCIDGFPLGEEFFKNFSAERGKPIKTFVALVRFAPFAEKEALRFKPAQERVESSLFDFGTTVR